MYIKKFKRASAAILAAVLLMTLTPQAWAEDISCTCQVPCTHLDSSPDCQRCMEENFDFTRCGLYVPSALDCRCTAQCAADAKNGGCPWCGQADFDPADCPFLPQEEPDTASAPEESAPELIALAEEDEQPLDVTPEYTISIPDAFNLDDTAQYPSIEIWADGEGYNGSVKIAVSGTGGFMLAHDEIAGASVGYSLTIGGVAFASGDEKTVECTDGSIPLVFCLDTASYAGQYQGLLTIAVTMAD